MKIKGEKFNISVHFSFIALILLAFFAGLGFLVLEYFVCLVLHEFVHAFFAKKLGYKIGKINLLATGAVLEAESDEISFRDEIIISISAPLFNLFFSILLLGVWWISPETYNYTQDLLVINLSIFAFNILPIFPLDGGRVLLAVLSIKNERKIAVKIARFIACSLSVLIFILFIISLFILPNFSLAVISVSLFIGAISEDKKASYKRIMFMERKKERCYKNGVEVRHIMVNEKIEKLKLLKMVNARFFTIFVLVDDNFNVKKHISEKDILTK